VFDFVGLKSVLDRCRHAAAQKDSVTMPGILTGQWWDRHRRMVIVLMVLASRNTAGAHPGTALSPAQPAGANPIDKTNKGTTRLRSR
jgi:hypothetical protein